MSRLDEYRKLENQRKTVQREISSIITRQTKLEAKLERKKKELAAINTYIRLLDPDEEVDA